MSRELCTMVQLWVSRWWYTAPAIATQDGFTKKREKEEAAVGLYK